MVQFFDLPESRSSLLGTQIGGAVGKGIAGGLRQALTPKKQKDLFPIVQSVVGKRKLDLDSSDMIKVYSKAEEYRRSGLDEARSSLKALDDYEKGHLKNYGLSPQEIAGQEEQKAGTVGKEPEAEHHRGLKGFDIKKTPIETLSYKDLFQLSKEQTDKFTTDQGRAYLERIREIAPGAVGASILSGLTFGGSNRLTKKIAPEFSTESLEKEGGSILKAPGIAAEAVPITALLKGANWLYKGGGLVARAVKAGGAFGADQALKDAIGRGELHPGDIGIAALSGGAGQVILEKTLPILKNLSSKFTFKAPPGMQDPKIKEKLLLDYVIKEAGVPMEALQSGEPQAVQKFESVLNDLKVLPPNILSEKISRSFAESNLENITRRSQVLEDQLNYAKKTKYLGDEIAAEEIRYAEENAPTKKRDATIAREEKYISEAEKELPHSVARLSSIGKELGKAKDNFSYMVKLKMPMSALEQAKNTIDRLSGLRDDAQESVKALQYQKNKGKPYRTDREIELEALNNAQALENKIATRPEGEVIRPDVRVPQVEALKGKRVIPGAELIKDDTQSRILKAAIQEYGDKIKQLKNKKLVAPKSSHPQLDKAIATAEKLVEQNKGNLALHERRQGLRDVGKALERQKKLKGQIKEDKRVQEVVNKALKEPSPENIKEAQDALYGKEEAAKVRKDIDDIVLKADKIESGKGTGAQKEAEFASSYKEKMKEGRTKFRTEQPSSGNKEQQKEYLNWRDLLNKIFKHGPKYYRKAVRASRLLDKLYKVAVAGGSLATISYPGKWIWNMYVDHREASKFSKMLSHEQALYRKGLKERYGPKRTKKIEVLSKNL